MYKGVDKVEGSAYKGVSHKEVDVKVEKVVGIVERAPYK